MNAGLTRRCEAWAAGLTSRELLSIEREHPSGILCRDDPRLGIRECTWIDTLE
jgi:hypothetical protein